MPVRSAARVLIVDEYPIFRRGLIAVLSQQPGFIIIGEASTCDEATEKALQLKPDVIIMDAKMLDGNGVECVFTIHYSMPEVRMLILTVSDQENALWHAIRPGAQGYLPKNASVNDMIEGIRLFVAGEGQLSPSMSNQLCVELSKEQEEETRLSQREAEILNLLGKGLTNVEIGKCLFISDVTVRTHLYHILNKLKLRNRAEAIIYAATTSPQ
jgi:DNA-binding NarL/FixJ family response regulator